MAFKGLGGGSHPNLASHDTLGLATQSELDTAIAGAAHPNLASHDTLGLATQSELDASIATTILKTVVDAKGDLLVATAADTVGRLAVGTNDHVLTADSAEISGVKWAAASGTHPDLAAHDTLGLATQTELNTHAAAADPHTVYWLKASALGGELGGALNGTPTVDSLHAGSQHPIRLVKTADESNSTTSLANVTDLTYAVAASEIIAFEFYVLFSSASLTTGIALALNGPASPTHLQFRIDIELDNASSNVKASKTAYEDSLISASVSVINGVFAARVFGVLENGANAGTFALRFASEIASSAVTVERGSFAIIYRT